MFEPCSETSLKSGPGGARAGAGRKPKPIIVSLPDTTPRWFCVRTSYDAERRAAIGIGLLGFPVFSPSMWRPGYETRRYTNGSVRPARPSRVVPLFRRYIFTNFCPSDPDWRAIWRLEGVDCLLSQAEMPIPVPDQAIAIVRALCSPNGCIYPPTHEGQLPVGTSARLLGGPLGDMSGICEWSDRRRVRLLMEILGGASVSPWPSRRSR